MQRLVLEDETIQVQCPTGYVHVKRIGSGLLFCRKAGRLPERIFQEVIPPFEREVATGALDMFCDFEGLENYESGYRVCWTEWLKRHPGKVTVHVYAQSKLVRMGLSVMNLAVPIFSTYDTLDKLYAALAARAPQFQPRSLAPALPREKWAV